jgi:16S rRNA (uracil1498-N3)-methyltransferase
LKKILAEYSSEHGRLPTSVLMLVGPEGDFTPAELALARSHGCQPITLGPVVLRVETAAIYCLSILSYELLV